VGQYQAGTDALLANPDTRTVTSNATKVTGNVVLGTNTGEVADVDAQGHAITVQGVTLGVAQRQQTVGVGLTIAGQYGDLVMQADGSYTSMPGSAAKSVLLGQIVADQFTYTVNDGKGNTSTTTLTISVVGQYQAGTDSLVANPDVRTVTTNTAQVTGNVVLGQVRR
jgi:VCBS repeat-containing protein